MARPKRSVLGLAWDYVRVYPPEDATTIDRAGEADPREAGLSAADIDTIWASVVRLYETGLQPAIGLCVRKRGKVILDRAIGHTHGNAPRDPESAPKTPATPRSLFNIYSASKAVTAMVVHLLDERGLLHLDDPVASYIPEFGRHGKEWITLRHVLTHRAGIPVVPGADVDLELITDPRRVLDLLCDIRPVSAPGRRLAYHALTGGYVLGEVVLRVTGRDLRQVLRSEILDPLGFESFCYGVKPEDTGKVAENAYTGPPSVPPYSWMLERSLGVSMREAARLSNDPRFLTAIIPSGNVVGTANEMSRFFELLLCGGELGGVRVFERRTVQRAVAETSYLELDAILGLPVRYGMGFMLGGKVFSPYGHDTERAFGHIGFSNVVGWADPDREISVGLVTSGKPFLTPGQLAWINIPRTIARVCAPGYRG
jgi:CubicO group peptidase (beta-lactamase class C family)